MGHEAEPRSVMSDVAPALALIAKSRNPILLVDAVDLAAAAAAVRFARHANAKLDHTHASHFAPLMEHGFVSAAPGEIHQRADVVMWIGTAHEHLETDESARRLRTSNNKHPRKNIWLGEAPSNLNTNNDTHFNFGNHDLIESLGLLRAVLNKRPVTVDDKVRQTIETCIQSLKDARFGVVSFAAGALSFLEQTNLMGLVDDLSSDTRWVTCPVGLAAGQSELARMSLALTGLTVPLSFIDGRAQHDPVLFNAQSCMDRGEVDLLIWLSNSETALPQQQFNVSEVLTLTPHATAPIANAHHISIGAAGIDHAALIEPQELGAIVALTPAKPQTQKPTAADVLNAFADHFETPGGKQP